MKSTNPHEPPSNKVGCLIAILKLSAVALAIFLIFIAFRNVMSTPEQRAAMAKVEKAKEKVEEGRIAREEANKGNEEIEKKQKDFHCLSGWDGSQRYVIKAVKAMLNDPDSFDHVETRVTPVANGRHGFVMKYRAKNAFGGTITNSATGSYSNADCSDVSIASAQ